MKSKFLGLAVIFLVTSFYQVIAQNTFVEGYIIKNDGSVVPGQVKYNSGDLTASKCEFRWFDISAVVVFSPEDISGFGYRHGARLNSVVLGQKKVFVACVVDGMVDLLCDDKRMYISDNKDNTIALSDKEYLSQIKSILVTSDNFKVPYDLKFDLGSLKKLFISYNESIGDNVEVFPLVTPLNVIEDMKNIGALSTKIGVLAGINYTSIYADGTVYRSNTLPEMTFTEVIPLAGLFYNRQLSRLTETYSLQVEIHPFYCHDYLYYEEETTTGYTRNDVTLNVMGIKFPVFLRFNLGKQRLSSFIDFGGYAVVYLNETWTHVGEIENISHEIRPITGPEFPMGIFAKGVVLGSGIKYRLTPINYLYLEVRGEYGSGIFNSYTPQSVKGVNLIAGFNFK